MTILPIIRAATRSLPCLRHASAAIATSCARNGISFHHRYHDNSQHDNRLVDDNRRQQQRFMSSSSSDDKPTSSSLRVNGENNNNNDNNNNNTIVNQNHGDLELRVTETTIKEYNDELARERRKYNVNATTLDRSKFTDPIKIEMPDAGDDMDATLVKWHKQSGDVIVRGDIICDIETEHFTISLDIDDENPGIMGDVLTPEGTTNISSGIHLCTIMHEPGAGDDLNDDDDDDKDW